MRSAILLVVPLLVATPAAAKDLALHQHVAGAGASVSSYEVVEYLTPSLRIVDGPHARTVIDVKAQTVTVVDKDAKTVWQASFGSLRRQTDTLEEHRSKAFDPKQGQAVTLAPTGSTETIAGHPAAEQLLQGGAPSGSVWLAKDLEGPADPDLWKAWEGLGRSLGPSGKVADAVGAKGVALRTVIRIPAGAASVTVTTEVTAVREESPAAALSAVPEGYARATRHAFSH